MSQALSDFDRVKEAVTIRQALAHYYGDLPDGEQIRLHPQCCDYEKQKSLSVTPGKGSFSAFTATLKAMSSIL